MIALQNLTTAQLRKIIAIKEQIEQLEAQVESIAGGEASAPAAPGKGRGKYKRSPAARAAMAAAQRARWAKVRGEESATPAKKKDRRSSPAVRAKLAAAARARWRKARAEGKARL